MNPLTGYNIYSNDSLLLTTTGTTATITTPQRNSYTMTIRVRAVGQWSMSQPSEAVTISTTAAPIPPRSNEAVTDFLLFDRNDILQYVRDDAISMKVTEEEYKVSGSFPYNISYDSETQEYSRSK